MNMKDYLSISVQRSETRLLAMISGLWMSRIIAFAVRNDVLELLSDGPCAARDIAKAKGFVPDVTERLLEGLAHLGVTAREGDLFALTEDGRLLLWDAHTGFAAMATLWSEQFDGAWSALDETARTARPGFDIFHGEPIFARIGKEPKTAEHFDRAMSGLATMIATEVAHHVAHASHELICDVGGGDGSLLSRIVKGSPTTQGIVFDQPHVVDRAKEVGARGISFLGGDFFANVPSAPVHILCNIIHDWKDDDARRILCNVRAAQPEDGTLYLIEMMLDDANEPVLARSTDLNMLVLTGGRERTRVGLDNLLSSAGYAISRVQTLADLSCLIVARPYEASQPDAILRQ